MKSRSLQVGLAIGAALLIVLLYTLPRQSASKREAVGSQETELSSEISQAIDLVASGSDPMAGIQKLLGLIEQDSTNAEAHFWLGKFSVQSGQLDKALVRFETVTRLDSANVDGWWELASVKFQQGLYDEALQGFVKTHDLDPTFDNALFFQGQCYQLMGDTASALFSYKTFLPLVEDSVVVGWLHNTIQELEN